MTPTEIFNQLQGNWKLERNITPGGVMDGRAVFNQAGDGSYDCEERGRLTLEDGTTHDVMRRYSYKLTDGQIHVFYADGPDKGKLFHVLEFSEEGDAAAEHLCIEDQYSTRYVFNLPEGFQITHHVKGPKKDYTSVTNFKRYP